MDGKIKMEVVLIRYKPRYDDCEEIIGIAISVEMAIKYVEDLASKYPYAYGKDYGTYYFEKYDLIKEVQT
jgi:hypothetical protein